MHLNRKLQKEKLFQTLQRKFGVFRQRGRNKMNCKELKMGYSGRPKMTQGISENTVGTNNLGAAELN